MIQRPSKATALPYTGGWDFLTVTCDGYYLKAYLNGIISQTFAFSAYFVPTNSIRDLSYIGYGDNSFLSSSFIDDLQIYKRSLNQTEIIAIMNANS